MNVLCAACGERYGAHRDFKCPGDESVEGHAWLPSAVGPTQAKVQDSTLWARGTLTEHLGEAAFSATFSDERTEVVSGATLVTLDPWLLGVQEAAYPGADSFIPVHVLDHAFVASAASAALGMSLRSQALTALWPVDATQFTAGRAALQQLQVALAQSSPDPQALLDAVVPHLTPLGALGAAPPAAASVLD